MIEHSQTADLLAQIRTDLDAVPQGDDVQAVVERIVALLEGCDHASLTMRDPAGRLKSLASTSATASEADSLQYDFGGPCVDAAKFDDIYVIDDVRTDVRWPQWSGPVSEIGIRSVLSVRLGTPDAEQAALNLYGEAPEGFDADVIDLAISYSALAANALHVNREIHDLKAALHTRHLIGVAQGILMNRYELTLDQSFSLLQRYSSHTNTKLRVVAGHVAEHGGLPEGG